MDREQYEAFYKWKRDVSNAAFKLLERNPAFEAYLQSTPHYEHFSDGLLGYEDVVTSVESDNMNDIARFEREDEHYVTGRKS